MLHRRLSQTERAKFEQSVRERYFRQRGITQRALARQLGFSQAKLCRILYRPTLIPPPAEHCIGITLTNSNYGSERLTWYRGAYAPIGQVARIEGLNPPSVYRRHSKGVRGPALTAPTNMSPHPAYYEIGFSQAEWQWVCGYAQAHGVNAARIKFGVPQGAVSAAVRGEWERLA